MKYYWFAWVSLVFSILMYIIGGRDVASDLSYSCETKNKFVVDGKEFVCLSSVEYFKDEK